MMPYDPMRDFQTFVRDAATELGNRVYVGPAPGEAAEPYAVIRNVGGPAKQAQIGLESWRIDVLIYDTSMPEARVISNKIHAAIATRGGSGTIPLPSIFGESGPVGLVDEDRWLPFVQRSYIVTFEV